MGFNSGFKGLTHLIFSLDSKLLSSHGISNSVKEQRCMYINKNLEAGLKTKLCACSETVTIMNSDKGGTQKVHTAGLALPCNFTPELAIPCNFTLVSILTFQRQSKPSACLNEFN